MLPAIRKSVLRTDSLKNTEENTVIQSFRGGVMPDHNNGLPRVGHTIVVYKQDMYLFGGCGPKNTYSSDIFCNIKMTLQWKELRGVGVVPTGRANHSAIVCGNKMIIYGGHRNLEIFDDLYLLNFDTLRWERVVCEKDQGPGPIFSHSAVFIPPTNSMIVVGGFHQRQGNMYVAHALDIRHLVWKGICGPASVNPRHIQLCSAVYHSQSTSLVVLGIVERDVLVAPPEDNPTVYMMNVFTFVWVEVNTAPNPESPTPFRMSGVWEQFIRDSITMGGVYDEKRQEWYFPLLMSPIDNQLMRRKTFDRAASVTLSLQNSMDSKLRKRSPYGVFKFSLVDMSWSLVSANFPKQVLQELSARKTSTFTPGERHSPQPKSKKDSRKPGQELFSPAGVSRFQHKYAYAFIEPSGTSSQASRKRFFVMHGGINTEEYAMLIFTPKVKRKQAVRENYSAFAELNELSLSYSRDGSIDRLSLTGDDDFSETESDTSRAVPENGTGKSSGSNVTKVGRVHRLESDPTLLPSMPSPYRHKISNRFAVMFHNLSSVKNEKLLPEPGCPVAVLDKESDVKAWAENIYAERRQWVAKSIKAARREDRIMRRKTKKMGRSVKADANSEDMSSDSDSETSLAPITAVAVTDVKRPAQEVNVDQYYITDFMQNKGLELFEFDDADMTGFSRFHKYSLSSSGATLDSVRRLFMTVRRGEEVQRLPPAIFQRASVANVTDLGGAMAYLLMQSALRSLEGDISHEGRRHSAHIRWRYLRKMVLNGEAASILHRANLDEVKNHGINVSSTSQLALVPDLHTRSSRPVKVPTRQTPYMVPKAFSLHVRSSEMTQSGNVMYHCVKRVN